MSINYSRGTRIQRRDGHLYIKSGEYGLIKEARLIAMLKGETELTPFHRVFFLDGNRENIKRENIVAVRFNETRFKRLPHSRIIYVPKVAVHKAIKAVA